MPVDEEPSALACTFDSALSGASCVYEAASGPGDVRDNRKLALGAGTRACGEEAAEDAALRKSCEKAVLAASAGAECALHSRLADERGRLTLEAAGCVEAVRSAISRTAHPALQPPPVRSKAPPTPSAAYKT